VGVAEDDEGRAGAAPHRGAAGQLRLPGVVAARSQLVGPVGIVRVRQQEASARHRDDLLVGQLALRFHGVVVAVHGDHRRDRAQPVQHRKRADVAGVQQQVHSAERVEERRRECPAALREVRVGNEAEAGGDAAGGKLGRKEPLPRLPAGRGRRHQITSR
jgi:hypothetical protein